MNGGNNDHPLRRFARRPHATFLIAVGLLVAGLPAPWQAAARSGCSLTWRGAGGDWPTKGFNNYQTNFQRAEKTIGPQNVLQLRLMWVAPQPFVDPGTWTPVVSGSCVYVAGTGTLYALDARTGKLMWVGSKRMKYGGGSQAEDYPPRTVTVDDGLVHVDADNELAPRGYAFDARTGRLAWESRTITFGYKANQFASAKVLDGIHVLFTTGPDFDPRGRPGYALLSAKSGKVLVARTTTPRKLLGKGFAGGGVWVDPAIDPVHKYAYAGTANPYNGSQESRYDNAIIKIDLDRNRKTFGKVVGVFKGDADCNGDICTDIDFAAGPTLFRSESGELWLAEMQKSGTLFVIDTKTMTLRWKKNYSGYPLVGVGYPIFGNASETAFDGTRLYAIFNPGTLLALDPETGDPLWASPLQDNLMSARPPVVANGVVYTIGANDTIVLAHDAATGALIGALTPGRDTGIQCSAASNGGMAIAHNMLFVNCHAYLAAYGLPQG